MNLEKSLAFYKDRFADAGDFTFVFVGQLRRCDDEAAGRAVPRRAAVHRPQGDLEGHRHPLREGRDREARGERASSRRAGPRSCSPGRSQYNQDGARRDPRDGRRAPGAVARDAQRGSRRHVRRLGERRVFTDSGAGVLDQHQLRLRAGTQRWSWSRRPCSRSSC